MTKQVQGKIGQVLIILLVVALVGGAFLFLHNMVTTYFHSDGISPHEIPDDFNDADFFIKYGHPEIKSLSVQFLTLLTGILVFSVTFSEKVINYSQASVQEKVIVTMSWFFLVIAIILAGIGMVCNSFALPFALQDVTIIAKSNQDSYTFYVYAFKGLYAMVMSGLCFVISLMCIVAAGIMKLRKTKIEEPLPAIDNQL